MPYPSPTLGYPKPTAPASTYPSPSLPIGAPSTSPIAPLPPVTPQNFISRQMDSVQLNILRALGVPLESDPTQWTPEEAEQQTTTAIAKIASVNPKLAEELVARSEGLEPDKGFWGNLKEVAGDLIAPVLSIGAKALDIISRPAHIIPALLMHDDDPWWEDIGQALSGADKSTWSDVLEQWGVDNPWVRGIVGFVGDVLTDPLTYVTFGFGGVGRAMAARVAAKTIGVYAGKEALEEAAKKGLVELIGGSVETHLTAIYDDLLKVRKFAPGAEQADAIAGIAAGAVSQAERDAVVRMLEAADYVHRAVSTVGIRKLPEQIALSVGRPLTKEEILNVLNAARKAGNFGSRASWLATKAVAGADPGIRFRVAVPFTSFRYISPALPLSNRIAPFQVLRAFVTGTSGMSRLMSHISAGAADWNVFRTWVDEGYSGVIKRYPEVGALLRGQGLSFGSMFYSKSEQIGRITARFAPHAAALRGGGILGTMAADFNVLLRQYESDYLNEFWTHIDDAGTVTTRKDLIDAAAKALDPEKVNSGIYARYRDLVPSRAADADLDSWWDEHVITPLMRMTREGTLDEEAFNTKLASARTRLREAKELRNQLSDAERDILFKLRELEDKARLEYNIAGGAMGETTADFEVAARLRPQDADEWAMGSYRDTAHLDMFVHDDIGDLAARRAATGFGPQDVVAGGVVAESVNGRPLLTHLDEAGQVVERDPSLMTRVRVRLMKPAIIDNRPIAERGAATVVDNKALIDELYADARKAAEKELSQQERLLSMAPPRAGEAPPKTKLEQMAEELHLKTVQERTDELVAEALRKRGFDGIVTYEEGGVVRAKVFDPSAVKVVDEYAPAVIRDKGYMPRTLTDEAEEFLRGKPDLMGRRTIYGAPKLVHDLHRFKPELTLEEAEREVADILRKRGYEVPEGMRIFERDPLRVHDKYVRRVTTALLHEHAGVTAGRMAVLADMAPGLLGGPAGTSLYRFKVTDLPDKVLAQLPSKVRKALEVTEQAHRRLLAAQYKEGKRASEALARIRAALEDELPPVSSYEGRMQKGAKLVRKTSKEFGAQLGSDMDKMLREQKYLKEKLFEWNEWLKKKKRLDPQEQEIVASLTQREAELAQRIKDISDELRHGRKLIQVPESSISAQALRKAGKARDAVDDFAERVQKVLIRANEAEAAGARRLERLEARLAEAIEEQNRLVAKYRMDSARPLVALEETIRAKTGFTQLQVKGLKHLAMPTYIAAEFHSALEKLPALNALHKEWRKWTQVWKEWATFRWPGFHIRNHMGAWFNNWLGGVDEVDYRYAIRIRKALHGKGAEDLVGPEVMKRYHLDRVFRGRDDVTWGELAARISDMGVGAANARATADVRTVAEAIEKDLSQKGPRGLLRSGLEKYDRRVAMPLTDSTENFHRVAGFLGGLRQTSGDFYGARMFVMMRQGDYMDLTDLETKVKDLLPFYKWFRTNFPYQLRNLIENPALPLTVVKSRDIAFEVQGLDAQEERAKWPKWMRDEFVIPLPRGTDALTAVMLDLPMSDLTLGAREFVSSFLPLVRPTFESYIAEKNLFSGQPLEGKQVPLADVFNLPVLRDVLLASGIAKESVDGKLMVSDKTQNLLSTIPIFSRFRNWLYAEPGRVQLRASTFFSVLLGMGLRPMDEEALTKAERAFYHDEVEPVLNTLRGLGYPLPSAKDLDPYLYVQLGLEPPLSAQS